MIVRKLRVDARYHFETCMSRHVERIRALYSRSEVREGTLGVVAESRAKERTVQP